MAGYIYFSSGQNTPLATQTFMGWEPIASWSIFESEEAIIVNEEKISLDEAISSDFHLYEVFHKIDTSTEENIFDDFYDAFLDLNSYEEYKTYEEKYPSLLPVIYAAKMRDKETYLKFYNFIFDRVMEEQIPQYIADLEAIEWAEGLSGEGLRDPFIAHIDKHYEIIATWTNTFNFWLWAWPIHIALTGEDLKTAMSNCDNWGISGIDDLSKQECYNYSLHYRATAENNYCDEFIAEYDTAICTSFFNSQKSK